jgi:hypothetical protein
MDLRVIVWEGVGSIHAALDSVQWRSLVTGVKTVEFNKRRDISRTVGRLGTWYTELGN